jgi:hypothetical protein
MTLKTTPAVAAEVSGRGLGDGTFASDVRAGRDGRLIVNTRGFLNAQHYK